MARKKKQSKKQTIGLSTNVETKKQQEEKLKWDFLKEEFERVGKDIVYQQALVVELTKKYEDKINKDKELFHAVSGFIKSLTDLAEELREISNEHRDKEGKFYTGEIDSEDMDSQLTYFRVAEMYLNKSTILANILATAYMDIFIKLQIDTDMSEIKNIKHLTDELKKGINDGK